MTAVRSESTELSASSASLRFPPGFVWASATAAYQIEGDTIVFTHTLVPKAIEGRGVASKLIRAALDSARDAGLKVVAQCPFVAAYIERHPEYRGLLARR